MLCYLLRGSDDILFHARLKLHLVVFASQPWHPCSRVIGTLSSIDTCTHRTLHFWPQHLDPLHLRQILGKVEAIIHCFFWKGDCSIQVLHELFQPELLLFCHIPGDIWGSFLGLGDHSK